MKRIESSLLVVLGTLAAFIGSESYRTGLPHRSVSSGTVAPITSTTPTAHRASAASIAGLPLVARRMRTDDVRDRIRRAEAGTYIAELLLDRDSALARWPDRGGRALQVWIGRGTALDGWQDAFVNEVRAAFETWGLVGAPVRFAVTRDSARADIHVRWVDRFREPISGKTVWSRDDQWWIVDGEITLALRHRDGDPLDAPQVRAIALHEIGHLLGLDHTTDAANIMAARVRVRDLSLADQATLRLLYSVPAGKVH